VQTTEATQITCRIDTNIEARDHEEEAIMVVFLKTSEEAVCDEENVCNFIFEGDDIPVVSGATLAFDAALQQYVLTIEGTNMDLAGADLHISDVS
jgi:hypothetical protein